MPHLVEPFRGEAEVTPVAVERGHVEPEVIVDEVLDFDRLLALVVRMADQIN